ncbi:MAG: family 43 glycosylhydrolase [Oscillospiraceae bacterium]|nr:family 43 glycosylhydrolase [Oscillospiraceae bacterium]
MKIFPFCIAVGLAAVLSLILAAKNDLTIAGDPGRASLTEKFRTTSEVLSSEYFCADPTAVEYKDRLYVYGTCDHQQYEEKGANEENTYEKIKSISVFSTSDMENWIYHGVIDVGSAAPWILNSWAPSVVSREEEDGKTHFYMYFSNSGCGVGVLTATDPLGPWTDPLGKPLISTSTKGLKDCPVPFDPGAVIDDNGDAYLSFGGGKAKDGTDYMPGSARIVKLGEDMLSFDGDFVTIPAPYFFEASELNYINGEYVYTYSSDWSRHILKWEYDTPCPGACSMISMKSRTPLDPDSWTVMGATLKNPGEMGYDYSNNHTHLQKFKGKWYMFYHTQSLRKQMNIKGGYRSICYREADVDENRVTIDIR